MSDELTAVAIELVARAYEAAADPARWPGFLNAFADAAGCEGTLIWPQDVRDDSVNLEDADASFLINVRKLLMPHLRRACLLHKRLAGLETKRSTAMAALDAMPTALWILGADGRLVYANKAGVALDRRHDGLWIDRNGRPNAAEPADRPALARIVMEAIRAALGQSIQCQAAACFRQRRSENLLHVMLYPLLSAAATENGVAAMFISDSSVMSNTSHVTMPLYGLTKTEALLASALVRGESLREYCESNGVTANTARTHLKRILSKTGTHRQAQLVSLLAGR